MSEKFLYRPAIVFCMLYKVIPFNNFFPANTIIKYLEGKFKLPKLPISLVMTEPSQLYLDQVSEMGGKYGLELKIEVNPVGQHVPLLSLRSDTAPITAVCTNSFKPAFNPQTYQLFATSEKARLEVFRTEDLLRFILDVYFTPKF